MAKQTGNMYGISKLLRLCKRCGIVAEVYGKKSKLCKSCSDKGKRQAVINRKLSVKRKSKEGTLRSIIQYL